MFSNNRINVFGKPLMSCSTNPLTGWRRTGYCDTDEYDSGTHVVCAMMTEEFLLFTYAMGNDLIGAGLKPGDKWCVCALRWLEAYKAGFAPPVDLNATNIKVLNIIDKKILLRNALQ
jgi:hypothetical protein